MTQPFGFNIHLRYVKDISTLHKRMAALNPSVCVVMVDDNDKPGKEDQTPYIKEFAARYPQTLIVSRVKHDKDSEYHLPPQNDPQKRPYTASPEDFLNKWGSLGMGNMSLYGLNEPLASEKVDPADMTRLVDWCCKVVELAAQRGVSVTIGNFGMGQPALNAGLTQWDERLDPLLKLLSKYRDLHFLGLHEYGPDQPYHWGRILFMLNRCEKLGVQPPRVVITEFGVDATNSKRNGYKARGWSGDYYMNVMVETYQKIYAPLISKGIVKGTCLFSYGNSGGWESFDVETDAPFFTTLANALASGALKSIPVTPTPQPAPVPTPPPPPPPETPAPVPSQESADLRRAAQLNAEIALLQAELDKILSKYVSNAA